MTARATDRAVRDGELSKVNPPTQYEPDEPCDGRGKDHDLGDVVVKVNGNYYCESCATVLNERCEECGMWRCQCRD